MDLVQFWLPLVASSLASGLAVWNFLQSPSKENATNIDKLGKAVNEAVAKLDTRLDIAERDLGQMRTVITQLPTRDMFHALDKELTTLNGEVKSMSVSVAANARSSERIEGFLIDGAKAQLAQANAIRPSSRS